MSGSSVLWEHGTMRTRVSDAIPSSSELPRVRRKIRQTRLHTSGRTLAGSSYISAEHNYQIAFRILFVMLIRAIAFPFALEIQCLHDFEITAKCSSNCIHLT